MKSSWFERTRYGWPYIIFIWLFSIFSWGVVLTLFAGSARDLLIVIRGEAFTSGIFLLLIMTCVFLRYRPSRSTAVSSEDAVNLSVVLLYQREVAVAIMAVAAILNTLSQLTDRALRRQEQSPWHVKLGEIFFQSGLLAFITLTGSTVVAMFNNERLLPFAHPGWREIFSALCAYTSIIIIRSSVTFVHAWTRGVPLIEFTREIKELRSLPVLLTELANVLLGISMAIVFRLSFPVFISLAGVLIAVVALLSNQARIQRALEATIVELKLINGVGHTLTSTAQTRRQILNALYTRGRELFGADSFAIYLYSDNSQPDEDRRLRLISPEADEKGEKNTFERSVAPEENALGLADWCLRHRRSLRVDDLPRQADDYGYRWLTEQLPYHSWLGVPLEMDNRLQGIISVASDKRAAFTEHHEELLTVLGQQAVSALENARLFELATIDGLTGLLTPRYLRQRLAEEFRIAQQQNRAFAIIMVDIDHFKRINDTYGHEVGNEVLKHLAKIVRGHLRDKDIPARYGGEEFTVLLPDTPLEGATKVAERLRAAVENTPAVTAAGEVKITVSLGVAAYPAVLATDQDMLINAADKALYQSKQQGRNRVTEAAASGQPSSIAV